MRVLIIEDDKKLAALIRQVLESESMNAEEAHDGDTGLEMALGGSFDVAIIDWMLPGRDGPSICRAIRNARVPAGLLMLTARTQLEDRVTGLDSGADDYLAKPFAFEELLARVRALARRHTGATGDPSELRVGAIVMDIRAHSARRGLLAMDLSATEWNLLELFLRHPGQTLSRSQILDYAWSFTRDVQPSNVDVYVSYLRKKLVAGGDADPIRTIRGVGYLLEADAA